MAEPKGEKPAPYDLGSEAVPTVSHGEPDDAITAMNNERQMSVRDSFKFWPKAILFSFVISLAIIMEVRCPRPRRPASSDLTVLGLRYALNEQLLRISFLHGTFR